MKKKIIIVISIILGLVILSSIYNFVYFKDIRNIYQSTGETDSAYLLDLSNMGKFSISDIGAGNPEIKGRLIKIPIGNMCIVNCLFDEDFDPTYLNIKSKIKIINVYSAKAVSEESDFSYTAIVFKNKKEEMQFIQIN